jgi:hypothetical protein
MKRLVLFACGVLLVGGLAFIATRLLGLGNASREADLPTIAVLDTATSTEPMTPTPTASFTVTPTATPTHTSTTTRTSTATPTLATHVLVVTAAHPGVIALAASLSTSKPVVTATPLPTVNVPMPPTSVEMVLASTANLAASGWARYEDNDSAIHYTGQWQVYATTFRASGRRYVYTDDPTATATLRFLGGGVRVRYVASQGAGVFEIRLDGRLVRTVDGYYPRAQDRLGAFLTTEIWGLSYGWHVLEIISTNKRHFDSKGTVTAIDAIEVYRVGGIPTAIPTRLPTGSATPTPSAVPAQQVVLVNAPPTVQPTSTSVAPRVIAVSLLIAYDENNNKAADPAEGVQGIPVRLVTIGTNQVIGSAYTNAEGYVQLEAMTDVGVRVVVPYFGKFWDISGSSPRFTLLLPPGNQPGLIP